jgi:hypothetical protein
LSRYAGKHRAAKHRAPKERKSLFVVPKVSGKIRSAALMSGLAVAATGAVVASGVASSAPNLSIAASQISAHPSLAALSDAEIGERVQAVSRSDERVEAAPAVKSVALSNSVGKAKVGSEDLTVADPKTLTRALMPQYGLDPADFSCIDRIWTQESNWNVHADNPTSSAYGIPQALPGSKMSSAGADWQHNAETQIRWGLGYIKGRYGSACGAWSFKASHGWY